MPIYTFECAACGNRQDQLVGSTFASDQKIDCRVCDAVEPTAVRVFTPPNVVAVYKGDWVKTTGKY